MKPMAGDGSTSPCRCPHQIRPPVIQVILTALPHSSCRPRKAMRFPGQRTAARGPTSALCGRVPHMEETRTEKISVNLTPSVLARLDDMRARRRWTRSTAAAVLIEHGLDSEDRMTALAGAATTSQE